MKSIDVHYEQTACFSLRNDSHLKFNFFLHVISGLREILHPVTSHNDIVEFFYVLFEEI